jgi:hypothetical protein
MLPSSCHQDLISNGWSVAEIVHCIVVISSIHSTSSFVLGCGVLPENDIIVSSNMHTPCFGPSAEAAVDTTDFFADPSMANSEEKQRCQKLFQLLVRTRVARPDASRRTLRRRLLCRRDKRSSSERRTTVVKPQCDAHAAVPSMLAFSSGMTASDMDFSKYLGNVCCVVRGACSRLNIAAT